MGLVALLDDVASIAKTAAASLDDIASQAAKAGVIALMQSMALEIAEHGVRANAICPGYIATSLMAGRARSEVDDDETEQRLAKSREVMGQSQAMHRVGEPEDIAAMVEFLSSDAAGYITGQTLVVDGGMTM